MVSAIKYFLLRLFSSNLVSMLHFFIVSLFPSWIKATLTWIRDALFSLLVSSVDGFFHDPEYNPRVRHASGLVKIEDQRSEAEKAATKMEEVRLTGFKYADQIKQCNKRWYCIVVRIDSGEALLVITLSFHMAQK